jgi:predicted DNA-binding transcriptional regulator YafY
MKRKPSKYRRPGSSVSTSQTVKRWLALIDVLRGNDYPNKAALAERLRFDARTIQKDIATLRREFGAPIEFDREQNGFYLTNRRWRLGG